MNNTEKQIQLYVHVPYCKRKCAYCSFCSYPSCEVPEEYVQALIREIDSYKEKGLQAESVFFGGGTPSLLSVEQLERLLSSIHATFGNSISEITAECNTDTITSEKMKGFRALGVNRISVGVQSLNDKTLTAIGRLHNASQALRALNTVAVYFNNFNADYMVGLPFQTQEDVQREVPILMEQGITHCSVYSLILEENTPLFTLVNNKAYCLPTDDQAVELYDTAATILCEKGFERYEISNFAKEGYACLHNSSVWRFCPYVGVGVAAHSFFDNQRFFNGNNVLEYIEKGALSVRTYEESSGVDERKVEYVMLALRTLKGVLNAEYQAYFGTSFQTDFAQELADPLIKKTCSITSNGIKIKAEYLYVSNTIIEKIIDKYL